MSLPVFRYHPDPVATGSVIPSEGTCECCGQERGWIYSGPAFGPGEYEDAICPWCIADGSAHAKLGVSFCDESGIGGYGTWDTVPASALHEVAYRTPGFSGWQQERWWTHCGDAAQFVGRAGRSEIEAAGPEAVSAIQVDAGLDDGAEWEQFFSALDKDGSPTAYLFRCSACGAIGGYQDCD